MRAFKKSGFMTRPRSLRALQVLGEVYSRRPVLVAPECSFVGEALENSLFYRDKREENLRLYDTLEEGSMGIVEEMLGLLI
jgi:hypothetical protein